MGLFLSCGMPAMPLSSATPLSVYPFRLPLLHLERGVVDILRYSLNFFLCLQNGYSMIANEKRHVIRNLLRSMIPIEEEHEGCF